MKVDTGTSKEGMVAVAATLKQSSKNWSCREGAGWSNGLLRGMYLVGVGWDTGSTGQLFALVAKTTTQLTGLLGPNCRKKMDWFSWRKFKKTICSESFLILSVCGDG